MENKLIFDKKGEFAINFYWENSEEISSVNFEAAEVCSDYIDRDNPKFITFDNGSGISSNCFEFKDVPKDSIFFTGFIKWDGCMEIHNLTYHFYYRNDILQRVVDLIYDSAKIIMRNRGGFN